jgi:hypothetical protein
VTIRRLVSVVALLGALAPSPAVAQGDANRQALELAYEGDRLYAQGRWADAYERFAAAEARAHSPVFTLYMARCRKNAGRLLDAKVIYQRVAAEALPSSAPKPFHDAVSDARTELAEVERRIPSVRVQVRGAAAPSASVYIDGKRVATPGPPTPLDPGSHQVEAVSGTLRAAESVTLTEGSGPVTVELELGTSKAAAVAGDTGAGKQGAAEPERGSMAPGWIALSVGVVGLGVGAVTGLMAAAKADAVKEGCVDGHCLASDAGELDSARTLATVSTVGFIVGGVGVAAAGVLFVVRPGGSTAGGGSAARSPTWIGLRGAF